MEEPEDGTASNKKLLPAEKGVAFCNWLFYKECLFKDLSIEERKDKRLEEEKPIWTEFWSWIETVTPTGGSKLEKTVNYALNHFKYLYTLLLYMPDYKNKPAGIEQLMPWSEFAQERCSGIIDDHLELPEKRGNLPI